MSFTPAPSGKDGPSDLIGVARRFGEPLYSLFLPSKVSRAERSRCEKKREVKPSLTPVKFKGSLHSDEWSRVLSF